jgi:signal transduction histidine kinase
LTSPALWRLLPHVVLVEGALFLVLGALLVRRAKRHVEHERSKLAAAKAVEQALREDGRRKDLFLAMLAHELRNPLSSIRMTAELMRLVRKDEDRMMSAVEVIARQADQLTRLVDELLDVSLITQDKIQFRFERLDLVALVAQAVAAARSTFEEMGVRFSMRLCTHPVRVRGDAVRLAQVISNLLNNAGKFTPRDGTIELTMETSESDVTLVITDSGIGIPREMLESIFDLFTQVDSSRARSHGGLGIGLTLVKRIVEVHGGTIRAESDGEGRGSCFTISLPVLGSQVDTPTELVAVARVGPSSAPSPD